MKFVKKRNCSVLAMVIGLSIGVTGINANAQVRDVDVPKREMNTVPLYESDALSPEAFLAVPQFREPGENLLQSGTLKLDWSTQKFEVLNHRYLRQFSGYDRDKGFSKELADQLQEYVDKMVGDGDGGGIVIRVDVGNNSWRGATGYSRMDSCCREPRVFSNKFRIASLTKMFTASVIIKLVEQGDVKWTDTLADWFSDESWYSKLPDNTITVEQLVAMKSGLGNYTMHPEVQGTLFCAPLKTYTPERLLELGFEKEVLLSKPSDKGEFYYSNTNYILLGLLIEKVVKKRKPYEQVVREEIFEPLNLFNTTFPTNSGIPYSYDNGYVSFPSEGAPPCVKPSSTYLASPSLPDITMSDATYSSPSSGWAAGGLVSNIDDVLEAVKAQIKGEAPSLSQATLDKRYENMEEAIHAEDLASFFSCEGGSPVNYGLGGKEYRGFQGHDGEFGGYNTVSFYNPETDTAIALNINVYPPTKPTLGALLLFVNIVNIVETGKPCDPASDSRRSVRTSDDTRTLTDILLGLSKEERKQVLIPH